MVRVLAACSLVAALSSTMAQAQPASCLSPDSSQWPARSKPYFLIIFDTSGSQTTNASPAIGNSCGIGATGVTRLDHARCALRNLFSEYGGRANFGLMGLARVMSQCSSACFTSCTYANYTGNNGNAGCGPGSGTTRAGGRIVVPIGADDYWNAPAQPTNVPQLLTWVDNDCTQSTELWADSASPLNGALRDAYRYLATSWTSPDGFPTYATPLRSTIVGERACRSVNVVLIADGDETCDQPADVVSAAAQLLSGVSISGTTFSVRTHVLNMAAFTGADAVAAAGGTGTAYLATNEGTITSALRQIVDSQLPAELCDNTDNDCNGCVDEGSSHFANTGQACCAWSTVAQRNTCLTNWRASISAGNPQGTLSLLPCTTVTQQASSTTWLCFDPGESCDNVDNNGSGQVDEQVRKCGTPAHCPQAEICNGQDDNCDGQIDEGACGVCLVTPTPEVCNGCDDDCDGIADNGFTGPLGACGAISPANCAGTISCKPPQAVAQPGACVPSGGLAACTNTPQAEVCADGVDNNCNGRVDEGGTTGTCVPVGTPGGLSYVAPSRCRQGARSCTNACVGFVGPTAESCNAIDDDCNSQVDDGVTDSQGHLSGTACCAFGARCGTGRCTNGTWTCQSSAGQLDCAGGVGPIVETCNGVDDDCNGLVDDVVNRGAECTPAPGRLDCNLDAGTLICTPTVFCGASGGGAAGGGSAGGGAAGGSTAGGSAGGGSAGGATAGGSTAGGSTSGGAAGGAAAGGSTAGGSTCGGAAGGSTAGGSAGGGSAGGATAGGSTAGGSTSGGAAGGATAGGSTAGGSTSGGAAGGAGGSTAGGSTSGGAAGGATAGGSTAGGSTSGGSAGGATAGGSTAGGSAAGGATAGGASGGGSSAGGAAGGSTAGGSGGGMAGGGCGCSDTAGFPPSLLALLALVAFASRRPRRVRSFVRGRRTSIGLLLVTLGLVGCQSKSEPTNAQSISQSLACSDAGCGDTQVDPNNCGSCGRVCTLPNARSSCRAGDCVVASCLAGFVDLDGRPSNGCEATCAGDGGVELCDGVDNDCDGQTDEGFDLQRDVRHCGTCPNDCTAMVPSAIATCTNGTCAAPICPAGTALTNGSCVSCTPTGPESCNGLDDDCNGLIDDALPAPPSTKTVCGVSFQANAAECTTGVTVACVMGAWRCTFPAGVCNPTCAAATEVCDSLDNNCDGRLNENAPGFGQVCASDDGLPGAGHGLCRTTGTRVCSGPNATTCSALKADCNGLPGGCTELCDGLDNDCDGTVDEPYTAKGTNGTYFVKPAVTRVATSLWIYSYEATRPTANAGTAGSGNGYFTSAPAGVPLDRTPACSAANRRPWVNLTPIEADQTCAAMGGFLCSPTQWRTACTSKSGTCSWAYSPSGPACTSLATASKFCNLASTFDANPIAPGPQNALLPTASSQLLSCYADFSSSFGNVSGSDRVYDLTGNAREFTRIGVNQYMAAGGSHQTLVDNAASCGFTSATVDQTYRDRDVGFRCCFSLDPTQ